MSFHQELDQYLNDNNDQPLSASKDVDQLRVSSLMNDMNNIRQTLQSIGAPVIGDLFRAKPDDVQETINSVYFLIKQRMADFELKQEAKQKSMKVEGEKQELQDQNTRLRSRIEQLQNELKDIRNQLTLADQKLKQERDKFTQEKDQLLKQNQQLLSKQTHFNHEIKNRDTQIKKFQDLINTKMFDKPTGNSSLATSVGIGIMGKMDQKDHVPLINSEFHPSRSPQFDFQLMVQKSSEEIQRRMSEENQMLKECLRQLQRELFDIVDLKTEIYLKRYRSELPQYQAAGAPGQGHPYSDFESEEVVWNEIERIRDEMFNLQFQETGAEIISRFQSNFGKLREFMTKIDKEMAQLSVFNEKTEATFQDLDVTNTKYSSITSVQQLKHLLKNYDALVEGQHQLLNQSITKMAKIPPPDEINQTFSRFAVLKDSELDEMRNFLNEHKSVMQQQYKEFDLEKRQFEEMTSRMEGEKQKISEERERIEAEVKKIKEMNQQIQKQLFISVK